MTDKKSKRIPASELTAYERWELPAMEMGGNDVVRTRVSTVEMKVKPLTAADLEKIRTEAYQEGFEQGKSEGTAAGHKEGLDKGLQEGLESGKQQGLEEGNATGQQLKQAEVDENLKQLRGVMEQLLDPIRLHDDEIEEALLNLVLAISRSVIKREVSLDSRQITAVIRDALALLPPTASNIKISINANDIDSVSAIVESISGDAQLIASGDILPGGCKVETLHSLIDFTIEKRFQKTVQQMLDKHSSSVPADEAPDLAESMDDMTDFHREILEEPSVDASPEEPLESVVNDPETIDDDTPVVDTESIDVSDTEDVISPAESVDPSLSVNENPDEPS